jgi:protein-tyrosine phosphatase
MHLITDSLLVGNLNDAQDPPVTVGGLLFVAEEHKVHPPAWLDFAQIPFKEFGEPNPILLAKAVQWLDDRLPKIRILVSCRAGMGRSVSVAIAYLCCVQGMAYDNALALAKSRRPGATPLPNLREAIDEVRQLRALQSSRNKESRPRSQPKSA